ncbi:MAG: methylenetetrahydrofolate reductase C-terminal domain-containing protein [Thermodesulfobacteriota bacterium]|nr:methylenetetrahydrofolate reductase C-terminal domain-containing protein [Thermodesulfobacteriota bacterium]
MIVAERKPFEEVAASIQDYKKVLVTGCATCVAVCLAGGEKEVGVLASQLRLKAKAADKDTAFGEATVQRQCDMEFLAEMDDLVPEYDALISLACGAGIQFLAERYPDKPVMAGVNTRFIGVNRDVGWYEEKCKACGNCVLSQTAGVCPVTMCAKSLFNGPCGGTSNESCEIHKDQPCAWFKIHERLSRQGRLANILEVFPANDWRNQKPQTLIQPGYEDRKAAFAEEK